ncbi:MAG: hypothetical protein KTR13_08185 [Saprospiraceae bacterium]|nr:hypothetical protein [Saprospiraceae bacterium]
MQDSFINIIGPIIFCVVLLFFISLVLLFIRKHNRLAREEINTELDNNEAAAESTIFELLLATDEADVAPFCKNIVYMGDDASRKGQTALRYSNEEERAQAVLYINYLAHRMNADYKFHPEQIYTISEYHTIEEGGKTFLKVFLDYQTLDGLKTYSITEFDFLITPEGPLLFDIQGQKLFSQTW